ncbi:MAG TPA: FAD-binding protein [Aliiroseovarius sp.]|nr:FAD-binding protein [Aliiroseovarius sp.]
MNTNAALSELSLLLGDRLSRSKPDLDAHGGSETHFPPAPPVAVAWPESAGEVSQILRICSTHGLPVIAYGAGTALEGHTSAIHGGVSLDMSRMNRLLRVDPGDMDADVGPGITREELNTELRHTGLFFPVDPGANATLGGMASTRASGTTAVRYGTMRDNVLGLEVVLADGRIITTGSRARKSASGYDLTGLFLGAEGTLGIITRLTLRLAGQPEAISATICAFERMRDAVEAVIQTIQMGIPMARIEFVDADTARAFNLYSGMEMPEKPHLLLEFHGSERAVAEDAARFGEIARDFGASGFQAATRTEERNALWTMRHKAYYACLALRPGATALVTDICVPISRLAQAVEETRADIAASSIPGPILGHVGDGNFHAILLIEKGNAAELAEAKTLAKRMSERALRLGGTITGEHGVGMGKLDLMAAEHGEAWQVMRQIKQALDPHNILNPGKLLPQD